MSEKHTFSQKKHFKITFDPFFSINNDPKKCFLQVYTDTNVAFHTYDIVSETFVLNLHNQQLERAGYLPNAIAVFDKQKQFVAAFSTLSPFCEWLRQNSIAEHTFAHCSNVLGLVPFTVTCEEIPEEEFPLEEIADEESPK